MERTNHIKKSKKAIFHGVLIIAIIGLVVYAGATFGYNISKSTNINSKQSLNPLNEINKKIVENSIDGIIDDTNIIDQSQDIIEDTISDYSNSVSSLSVVTEKNSNYQKGKNKKSSSGGGSSSGGSSNPVIEEPVVEEPVINDTIEIPLNDSPQIEEPVVNETIEEIINETPIIEEPVINETPVIEEPVVENPMINETPVIEEPQNPIVEFLQSEGITFDGVNDYIEIDDNSKLSVDNTGEFTISLWLRPDTLIFENDMSSGYVNILGKGESGSHEWTFRMYSKDNTQGRDNRINFYLFNNDGGLGAGSYVQEDIVAGEWIHLVARITQDKIYLYKDGVLKDSDYYNVDPYWIVPQNSNAPLRIGSRNLDSYFKGGFSEVAIFDKALSDSEIVDIFNGDRSFNFLENSGNYVSSQNLVSFYRLDDESTTIKDLSNTANDGILLNHDSNPIVEEPIIQDPVVEEPVVVPTPEPEVPSIPNDSNPVITNGLISYWNFDDGSAKDSYSIHDGVNSGAVLSNGYAQFDGINDIISVKDHDDLSPAAIKGEHTISVWVKVDNYAKDEVTCGSGSGCYVNFMGKGDSFGSNGNIEWQMRYYSEGNDWKSRIFFHYVFNPEGGLGVGSRTERPSQIDNGEWFHFVGVYTGSENLVYKDGVHTDTDPTINHPSYGTMDLTNGDSDLHFGWNDGSGGWFKGSLDEIMYFDRVLSEAEINEIYNSQKDKVIIQ